MIRSILRALTVALLAASAATVALVLAYSRDAAVSFEMDRELPSRFARGLYPPERDGDYTFAWSSREATLSFPGLSRAVPWECTWRVRGARGGGLVQPSVQASIDGLIVATTTATNEPQDFTVMAPARRSSDGLTLAIAVSPTVVPGPSDTRELGVQVDRAGCRPQGGAYVLPPRATLGEAALAGALFGLALAFSGITFGAAIVGAIVIGIGQAMPLSAGPAPYAGLGRAAVVLAGWIALASVLITWAIERATRMPLRRTARFAILFSAASLYLQLLGLLHPSKLIIDAVFHAHRLDWVLGGRYFFTQPMPGGVSFPYAIGLYVFAAPWSLLTNDHVTLLRVVVTAAQVVAGGLLYPLVARAWHHRLMGAIAVALFSLVPLPYELLGNANLANVFAQSVALAAVVAASCFPLPRGAYFQAAALFAITSLAFLSHVSTFAQLAITLLALAAWSLWKGGAALRWPARWIVIVTIAAALCAVALYYGHFADVYVKALRVRAASAVEAVPAGPGAAPATRSFTARLGGALALTEAALGWPILVLAALGAWQLWQTRARDRATFAILAWSVAYLLFLGVGVMRVSGPFQRYAAEFVGRVVLATYPAAVMLAGRGAGWAWEGNAARRAVAVVLLLAAVLEGARRWEAWFA